jgi:ribonuclease BN (tRNA processing enzyme)
MRLTVLGGSAASPNTGQGCSGYLVEGDTARLLLDPGPGTLQELRRHTDFRSLSGVLVSHMHLDHVLDLLALRHALAYNPIPAPAPIPVWLPPGGSAFLARATAPFDECDEPGRFDSTVVVREYDPASSLVIGDLSVTFAPAVHYVPAWAMRIDGKDGSSLGYTGDTGPAAVLGPLFQGVRVLLAEATLRSSDDHEFATRGSLTAAEAGALADDAGAGMLVLTHMWEEYGVATALRDAAGRFPRHIELARPGLSIDC